MELTELITGEKFVLKPFRIVWIESSGQLVFEHEPGVRVLCGAETWGYHVWGAKAYSMCIAKGRTPIVLVDEPPKEIIKNEEGWITLAFRTTTIKPWLPVSLVVKGVDKPVRKGTLVAIP